MRRLAQRRNPNRSYGHGEFTSAGWSKNCQQFRERSLETAIADVCVRLNIAVVAIGDCHRVELRALCNEVPRTPPGPEGSNGIGIASGAADHPKFLAMAVAVDARRA